MPVFGLTTGKASNTDPSFNNRYWVLASNLEGALGAGDEIVDAEKVFFGQTVRFVNNHAWVPNALVPGFNNRSQTGTGAMTDNVPTNSVPCVEVIFTGAENSYPSSKLYRVHMNPSAQVGIHWSPSYLTAIQGAITTMLSIGLLCSKGGFVFTEASVNAEVVYRQTTKRWHNRQS